MAALNFLHNFLFIHLFIAFQFKLDVYSDLVCTYFVVVIKQQTTVTDKVKHRLEQLDDFEEVRDFEF